MAHDGTLRCNNTGAICFLLKSVLDQGQVLVLASLFGPVRLSGMSSSVAVVNDQEGRGSSGNFSHGYYCCVPLCQNRSVNDPSLSFHCFPNDRTRTDVRNEWIVAIRRDEGLNFRSQGTQRCALHTLCPKTSRLRRTPRSQEIVGGSCCQQLCHRSSRRSG